MPGCQRAVCPGYFQHGFLHGVSIISQMITNVKYLRDAVLTVIILQYIALGVLLIIGRVHWNIIATFITFEPLVALHTWNPAPLTQRVYYFPLAHPCFPPAPPSPVGLVA